MEDIFLDNNKKKKSTGGILSIITLIILIFIVIFIASQPNYGKRISTTDFQEMVTNGEVQDVYAQGGTAIIRVVDSAITDAQWKKRADYYVTYTDITIIYDIIDAYNNQDPAPEVTINFDNQVQGESWVSSIVPYISLIIMIALVYMFYRMIRGASKGNGAMSFGKSKARIEKPNVKFSDIAGADEEKEETREIVEFLKNPQKFRAVGARIPKGVLLVGPPGTGKTLLAKAVAGESNVPFFSISGSDFVELYVGVGASRVRDLFDTAKRNAPCIVFIDEIDAVGRQRGAGLGGGNDEREQTLNQLLVEMDGFQGNTGIIVLAATNRADVLDPALLRPGRFDRQIYVNVPDVKGREGIMKIHAKNKPIDKDVDFTAIARLTSGFTGADIENFLNEAAILAARDNRSTITMEDITEGINKVTMGPQKKSHLVSERDKKITAYHESGHAILAKLLNAGETVHEVSIIPRGVAGGYTSMRDTNDENYYTKDRLLNKICISMGGRIAEELVFGEITTGASNDIQQATKIAHKMVTEWGMSNLGFINYGTQNEVFIGRDYQKQVAYSETTSGKIDEEVSKIIDACYKKAKKTLEDNRQILENMATLLLDKETIYTDEVDMLIGGADPKDVAKSIDKKEKSRKKKEEKIKKDQEIEQAKKLQQVKLQAATALNKAGILSTSELEMIKKEVSETGLLDSKEPKTTAKKLSKRAPTKEVTDKSETKETSDKTETKDETKSPKSKSDTDTKTLEENKPEDKKSGEDKDNK